MPEEDAVVEESYEDTPEAAAQEEVAFGSPRCTAAKLFLKLAKVESSQKVSPKAFQILTLLR